MNVRHKARALPAVANATRAQAQARNSQLRARFPARAVPACWPETTRSLQDTVGHAGKSIFGLQKGVAIGVRGGRTYTISAYVKLSSASRGQALKFALACYAAPRRRLGWSYTPTIALVGERSWQYAEGQATVPSKCVDAVGSPRVALTGMTAGEVVNVDEMTLRPYRAALFSSCSASTVK